MSAITQLRRVAFTLPTRAVSVASLRVETIADTNAFAELREDWNELLQASRSDSLFLTWEWLHTWWTHAGGNARLAILAVRRGDQLVGIAPLQARTLPFGGTRLEFLATGRVGSDYLDVIVRPGSEAEALASLASHIQRSGAILDMRQVRVTQSSATSLARRLRGLGSSLRAARTHRCPFIDLSGLSWDDYLGSLGSQHRYDFRRKLRKIESRFTLNLELAATEASRRALLPVLFDLHRLRCDDRGDSDGLLGLEAFHERISHLALARGWLRLFVLRLDGIPAAAIYGFRYGRGVSFYQSGFDPRFRSSSVGSVALGLAIKSAIEEGAAEFDLLHGEEPYKFHWATRSRRLGRLTAFPSGPIGRLCWAGATATATARRVLRGLRNGVTARRTAKRRTGGGDAAPAR